MMQRFLSLVHGFAADAWTPAHVGVQPLGAKHPNPNTPTKRLKPGHQRMLVYIL